MFVGTEVCGTQETNEEKKESKNRAKKLTEGCREVKALWLALAVRQSGRWRFVMKGRPGAGPAGDWSFEIAGGG